MDEGVREESGREELQKTNFRSLLSPPSSLSHF
jgi:hypothetical protein